ncbi:MAG: hypothetical protein A2Y80_08275 [Deltaproteobacteria bacterium RBG_13_58_19]|nr:MAG: hypothetical protein A2Y80_08275 [Deltaproteobacteria bacterium RBG_13_58_19]
MFFKPDILALFVGALLVSSMLLYADYFGVKILRHWDIRSGSELQLALERKTYLITTLMAYAFAFQAASLFLFICTADHLHVFFTGAMCAAGSLNVNPWGYPAAVFKVVNFLLAGMWLTLNYADNQGYDYPLVRQKYLFLLAITPMILAEAAVQGAYFLDLKPEVITSCCGTLFTSVAAKGFFSELAILPPLPTQIACFAGLAATLITGIFFYRQSKGGYLFSSISLLTFIISWLALFSFICLYIYELPTHHCPFCILHPEYHYIGYLFYLLLLGGGLAGLGVGLLMPFRKTTSLEKNLPAFQKRLTLISLFSYVLFAALATYEIVFSNLTLK